MAAIEHDLSGLRAGMSPEPRRRVRRAGALLGGSLVFMSSDDAWTDAWTGRGSAWEISARLPAGEQEQKLASPVAGAAL